MCREQLSLVQSRIYYIISYCRKKNRYFYKKISRTQNLVKENYVNWQILFIFAF